MALQVQAALPVLASLNIHQTLDFYIQQLGFTAVLQHSDYAIVCREGAEIHFWRCADPHIAENTSCYIRVTDVEALYQEFTAKQLALSSPIIQPWGMKELYVIDPHGNLLKWGQHL